MNIEMKRARIIRVEFQQEKGDSEYGRCIWADFVFDTLHHELAIYSDRGNYAHCWPQSDEPFLELMARTSGDYLLKKMCRKTAVNWEATKNDLIEVINENEDLTETERKKVIERLNDLEDYYDLEESIGWTSRVVEEWNEDYGGIDDVFEYVVEDYTGDEKEIAAVFEGYIQPMIRAYLKSRPAVTGYESVSGGETEELKIMELTGKGQTS